MSHSYERGALQSVMADAITAEAAAAAAAAAACWCRASVVATASATACATAGSDAVTAAATTAAAAAATSPSAAGGGAAAAPASRARTTRAAALPAGRVVVSALRSVSLTRVAGTFARATLSFSGSTRRSAGRSENWSRRPRRDWWRARAPSASRRSR